MATLEDILNAKIPTDLFKDETTSERTYLRLLQVAHPDMYGDESKKKIANEAFINLNQLWDKYQNKTDAKASSTTIKTRKHEYTLGSLIYEADGFSYFEATYDAGYERAILAIPQSTLDNDLNENATEKLVKLKKEVDPEYVAFFPEFLEAFRFDINGELKQILAYKQPKELYSLTQVLEDYPEGISGRDIAWIFRRLLIAIGNEQEIGIIHGGVNLDSVLIQPEQHGLVLTNWQYAIETGETLTAIPMSHKEDYPQYVFDKAETKTSLDIMLAAKTMTKLLSANAPKQLRVFFKGCQLDSLPAASVLLYEFDELLKRIYGPKKFHEFRMKRKS